MLLLRIRFWCDGKQTFGEREREREKGERDRGGERVGENDSVEGGGGRERGERDEVERAGVKVLVVNILLLPGHNSTLTSDL